MYIYRIEHAETHDGPYGCNTDYSADESLYNMGYKHVNKTHPNMWLDCMPVGKGFYREDHYCGFDSIERLVDWFDGWFTALENNGFIVAIYSINPSLVDTGNYQSIFIRDKAERVDCISISDMLVMKGNRT